MIRSLSNEELEQTSGGFYAGDFIGVDNGHFANLEASPYVLGLAASTEDATELSDLVGMAPPEQQPRFEPAPVTPQSTPGLGSSSLPICRDRRGRHAICQEDGVYEHWERYRPKQPAFRSRFINR